MVIKDSYGNVEIPFFMNSFEEIYVTDVRFFDLNTIDFVKEQGITDVLFTMCTYSAAGQNWPYRAVSPFGITSLGTVYIVISFPYAGTSYVSV